MRRSSSSKLDILLVIHGGWRKFPLSRYTSYLLVKLRLAINGIKKHRQNTPLIKAGGGYVELTKPTRVAIKYLMLLVIAVLTFVLNNSIHAQGMVLEAARITPEQLLDPDVAVAVGVFDPVKEVSREEAATKLEKSNKIILRLQPSYWFGGNEPPPKSINLILSQSDVDKDSSLLGLYLLNAKIPILLIIKKNKDGFSLENPSSWSFWMANLTNKSSPNELIRAGIMSGLSIDEERLASLLDAAFDNSSFDNRGQMTAIRTTFLNLAQFQKDALSRSFGVDNISSLVKRARESLVDKPNLIPLEIIPFINEPSLVGFNLLIALLDDPSLSIQAKKTCENPLQKIAARIDPSVLAQSFPTIMSQTSSDARETFLNLISQQPSVLPTDIYAQIVFDPNEPLSVRFAALRCLDGLKLPKSPSIPSRSSFLKKSDETLKVWIDFLSGMQ